MNFKKLILEFVCMFSISLVTASLVTYLWNLIRHGAASVEWDLAFIFAILFGILLTWQQSRKFRENNE